MDDKHPADRVRLGNLSVPLPHCDQGGLVYPGDPACRPLSGPFDLDQKMLSIQFYLYCAYHNCIVAKQLYMHYNLTKNNYSIDSTGIIAGFPLYAMCINEMKLK